MSTQFYKEVTLDSREFRTGDLNRPTFYFEHFMDDMDYLNLSRVIMPVTYYVFTSPSYNSMTINNVLVTWPPGNYTAAEWIAVIVAAPAATAVALSITYSFITNKLTFTGNVPLIFGFDNTQLAHVHLGFNAGASSNGTSTFVTPNAVQFSGPNYAVLHTRIASVFNGKSIYFSKVLSDNSPEDKFIIVPITTNRNEVVFYESLDNRFFEWFDSQTRSLEFYFTLGTRTEVLNFNGHSFQIKMGGYTKEPAATEKQSRNQIEQY